MGEFFTMSLTSHENNIYIFQQYVLRNQIWGMSQKDFLEFFNGYTALAISTFLTSSKSIAQEMGLSSFRLENNVASTRISNRQTIVYKFPTVSFSTGCRYIFVIQGEASLPTYITIENDSNGGLLLCKWTSENEHIVYGNIEDSFFNIKNEISLKIIGQSPDSNTSENEDIFSLNTKPAIQSNDVSKTPIIEPKAASLSNNNFYENLSTNTIFSPLGNNNSPSISKPAQEDKENYFADIKFKKRFKKLVFLLIVLTIIGFSIDSLPMGISCLILSITGIVVTSVGRKILKSKGAVIAAILVPVILIVSIVVPIQHASGESVSAEENKVTLSKSNFDDYFTLTSDCTISSYGYYSYYADYEFSISPKEAFYNSSLSSSTITVVIGLDISSSSYTYSNPSEHLITVNLLKSNDYEYSSTQSFSCSSYEQYWLDGIYSITGVIYT